MMHSTSSVLGSESSSSSSSSLDFVDDFDFGGDSIDGGIRSCAQTEETKGSTKYQPQQHTVKTDSIYCTEEIATKGVSFSNGVDFCHDAGAVNFLRLDSTLSDFNDPPVDNCHYPHHNKSNSHPYQQQHSDSSYSLCLDPSHSTYSSFLSSYDSDNDSNSDQSKKNLNNHKYNIKGLPLSSTTAAAVALKAVGTTTFTAASAAAGALSKISVRDGINCVKPLLSNKKKINPLLQQDTLPFDHGNDIHNIQQQHILSAGNVTKTPPNTVNYAAKSEVANTSNCSEAASPVPLVLPPVPVPSPPSLSTLPPKLISFKLNATTDDDKASYETNHNSNLVLQTAMASITPQSFHDQKSSIVWMDHDGQVLHQFDAESGRGYDIDVSVEKNEGAIENGSIFASLPLIKETNSERICSGPATSQKLGSDVASASSCQPTKGEHSAEAIKNRFYKVAVQQSQCLWRGTK